MTHLCLVSDQPVPNLLPVLDDDPSIKPDKVVLAVSAAMRKKAAFLEQALKDRRIACETLDIPDPYDLRGLQDRFIDWLDKRNDMEVLLNVTGGTKPMAIAAQEAFRMAGKPVFYVSVDSDEIMWMDIAKPTRLLEKSLTLKTYLGIHGYSMNEESLPIPEAWNALGTEMLLHAAAWQKALSQLNWYAMQAERRDVLDMGRITDGGSQWDAMMEQLYHNEIIRDRVRLHFRSPQARAFANGGWIEYQIFDVLRRLPGVQSPRMNVQIADAVGNRNELDVAFLCRNRLFIVECKTKRLDGDVDDYHGPAADAVYKLDALRKTGGLRTKGVLVSFMPVEDRHKHRAASAGITIIDQNGLPCIKERLINAIK